MLETMLDVVPESPQLNDVRTEKREYWVKRARPLAKS